MYRDSLTSLERDAIAAFVSGSGPVFDGLRAQLAVCRITAREFTGVGFFTDLVVPQRLAVPEVGRRVFSGVNAEVDGLQYGVGFLLFVENGLLDMLEGFTYADARWPDRIEGYTIKSDEDMNEGLPPVVKADRAVVDDHDLREDPSAEFLPADPAYRRLHRAVRFDPESVWEELEAFLCAKKRRDKEVDAQDLIEDLMFWHGDAFFDRVESLVARCPSTREMVAWAVVEGVSGDGVTRFHDLQQRLREELEAGRRKLGKGTRVAVLAGLTTLGIESALRALLRRRR